MLIRSLSAPNFSTFWHYWNPIWGYYLSKLVMRPLARFLPKPIALLLTFITSGLFHDLAIFLVKRERVGFLSLWFGYMGIAVIVTTFLNMSTKTLPLWVRGVVNIAIIAGCFICAKVTDVSHFI
ncbi:acyltransferase [Alteromonas sp. KUL49]|nr:acyltransferase [Alteromonas sp. KUL49]